MDEWGSTYQTTYLRRAKGLIKNGRARWVDERTIRLTHPPDIHSEDETMNNTNEQRYDNDGNIVKDNDILAQMLQHVTDNQDADLSGSKSSTGNEALTDRLLYDRISAIANETTHINDALRALLSLDTNSDTDAGGYGIQGKAEAIASVIIAREETNRQMIGLLEKMYDNAHKSAIEPQVNKDSEKLDRLRNFCETMRNFTDADGNIHGEVFGIIENMTKSVFA